MLAPPVETPVRLTPAPETRATPTSATPNRVTEDWAEARLQAASAAAANRVFFIMF